MTLANSCETNWQFGTILPDDSALSGDCEGSERSNPAIKAHLIRGAFYVILLVAICTIAIPAYAMTITVSDPNDGDTRNFDPVFNDQRFAGCGLFESFDTVTPPALPPGWTAINAINPDGILWQTSNQEGLLVETLRRLGIGPARLLDHHIKILMHINPKLDRASAAIKLAAGSLV